MIFRRMGQVLHDASLKPAKDENGESITFRIALLRALGTDAKQLNAVDKLKRFALFSRIVGANAQEPIDLTIDELKVAQDAIDVWPTLLYGQMYFLLNDQGT